MVDLDEVWVTGLGAIGPYGQGSAELARWIASPKPCFHPMPAEWAALPGIAAGYVAALPDRANQNVQALENVSTDRACAMALIAAQEAWDQAGFGEIKAGMQRTNFDSTRFGVYWGTGMSGLHTAETTYQRFFIEQAPLRPMTVVRIMANAAAGQIALRFGLKGANQTYSVACASSAIALGEALCAIRSGRLDAALAGGSEAMLKPGVMSAWSALRVMTTMKAEPNAARACRPFGNGRAGLVIGEGAACFVLERAAHARARGARALAVLAGYGNTCDAASLVHPQRDGQSAAMNLALADAKLVPSKIHSINAHATGTDAGDVVEAQALAEVFGKCDVPPVCSSKALHGHLLGAAGALEAAVSVMSLQSQLLPAALHLEEIDPRCAHLDIVRDTPRAAPALQTVMSNSFAFGGSNATLIFKRADQ